MKIKELYDKSEPITLDSYLTKCGVKDIDEFINPQGKYIDDFTDYMNMVEAVKVFRNHMIADDGAYILCDSGDTDGITSATIIYQYMKHINPNWDIEILLHTGKQRGLQDIELYDKILKNHKGLLIIPDSGTNDREQAKCVFESGTDIIILDHHTPKEDSVVDVGVLVNNQINNNKISSNGSGCLVTYKFLKALDDEFEADIADWFVDLVALSLVSDSMNMSDEQNRTYYHYGLETIECINNDFLREMFLKFIGDKPYTQRDISFKIIPKINSICRSKDQELKMRIIKAFCGQDNINDVLSLCADAHKNQIKIVNHIIEENEDKISEIADNQLILLSCDDMPRSYSGLIAGKVMNMCDGKPTIVGKVKDGYFMGSLRSPIPLRTDLDANELVDWANGHEDSCGIQIPVDNLQALVDYYNALNLSYEPCIEVLKSFSIKSIPSRLFSLFGANNDVLWGHGISRPTFHITLDYIPSDFFIMGKTKTTLKISKNNIDIMFFFMDKKKKAELGLGYIEDDVFVYEPKKEKMSLEIIGTFGINEWNGNTANQIIADKYEVKAYNRKSIDDIF